MKVLVTGGCGFIGSHIVAGLVKHGYTVRVIDNLSTGHLSKLGPLFSQVELVFGDLSNSDVAHRVSEDVDVILHHAPGIQALQNILAAARDCGVRRLVFASSCAVYGNATQIPCTEDSVLDPQTPYAVEKAKGEELCRRAAMEGNIEAVIFRYFNVFGPYQDATSVYEAVVPRFIEMILAGKSPIIYGDGEQTRDFTPVENVVAANLAACIVPLARQVETKIKTKFFSNSTLAPPYPFLVCNVGTGEGQTLRRLVAEINRLAGCNVTPKFDPTKPVGLRHSAASIQILRERLGVVNIVKFSEGLERLIKWYKLRYQKVML